MTKNKKILILALAAILVLSVVGAFYYLNKPGEEKGSLIDEKLRKIDDLRKEANVQPLTREEADQKIKEIDSLREKQEVEDLSLEEIEQRIKEIDRLRQQQ